MITLLTGIPGSGKTLYAVDKLLRSLIGTTVPSKGPDGQEVQLPRTIYSNINGLLFEHEKLSPEMLNTWHEWAKPGAIIVADEIQQLEQDGVRVWEKAPAGSKAPACIKKLETHRHMGVDFIMMTQHPMLVHDNLTRLVGRHLHMRRLGNMPFSTVYEWDGCSRTLLYKSTVSKAPFRFRKSGQDMYKSAEVHTKQKRTTPTLLWVFLAAVLVFSVKAPGFLGDLKSRFDPDHKKALASATPQVQVAAPVAIHPASAPAMPSQPQAPTGQVATVAAPQRPLAGCMRHGDRCECLDTSGAPLEPDIQLCLTRSGANRGPAIDIGPDSPRVASYGATPQPMDVDVLAYMRDQRQRIARR